MTGGILKTRGNFGHRDTQREGWAAWRQRREGCGHKLGELRPAGKGQKQEEYGRRLSGAFRGSLALPTAGLWTDSLQTVREQRLLCLSAPSLGCL